MSKGTLWLFLHLPKTGGTTCCGHIYKHFAWDIEFIEMTNWGVQYRKKKFKLPFSERPLEEREKAKVIGGHRLFYGDHRLVPEKSARYFTFLRDPAERCVSAYNFARSRDIQIGFDEWYQDFYNKSHQNFMVRFYFERMMPKIWKKIMTEKELRTAQHLLRLCWFVGLTEKLDEDLPWLFKEMGINPDWKNYRVAGCEEGGVDELLHPAKGEVIKKYFILDEETRQMIHEDNILDYKLYQHAKELRLFTRSL